MRIRTVKPEFWTHPVLGRLSDQAKLLAVGLLNYADDEGYFLADPVLVRNAIRPFDDDSGMTTVALRELSDIGYVELSGHSTHGQIGRVVKFKENQVINKPKTSKIKDLFECGTITVPIPEDYREEGKGTGKGTGNREGRGEEETPTQPPDQGLKSRKDFDQGLAGDAAYVKWAARLYWPKTPDMPIDNAIKDSGIDDPDERSKVVSAFVDQLHCIGDSEKAFPLNLLKGYFRKSTQPKKGEYVRLPDDTPL